MPVLLQTSLNDLVDGLTVRVCELEQSLCEEQERREEIEAEKTDLEDRMKLAEEICTGKYHILSNKRMGALQF